MYAEADDWILRRLTRGKWHSIGGIGRGSGAAKR